MKNAFSNTCVKSFTISDEIGILEESVYDISDLVTRFDAATRVNQRNRALYEAWIGNPLDICVHHSAYRKIHKRVERACRVRESPTESLPGKNKSRPSTHKHGKSGKYICGGGGRGGVRHCST